jgi:hypothetical protein
MEKFADPYSVLSSPLRYDPNPIPSGSASDPDLSWIRIQMGLWILQIGDPEQDPR